MLGRGRLASVVWMGAWLILGCGDEDPHEPDGSPGTVADAGPSDGGQVVDGSPADASSDAAPVDAAPVDAGPSGPTIESVTTADGFHQVRQGSTVVLVISGSELGDVDAVAVGELAATVISAEPDEVRAELVVPHGTAPGPREVSVSGPGGSASLADAIETTLYVVAPDAPAGGRGTFESPLLLCDPETVTAIAGDTISLLAGDHVCDAPAPLEIAEGVTVIGAGRAATLVRGATQSFPGFLLSGVSVEATTALRGFTVTAPAPLASTVILVMATGTVAFEDLGVEGPGVLLGSFQSVSATDLHVECGGSGEGLTTWIAGPVIVTSSSFTGCQRGVSNAGNSWTISSSTFERNGVGIWGDSNQQFQGELIVNECELIDNGTGIQLLSGGVATVNDTVIRDVEVTPEAMSRGISMFGADLTLNGGEIVGHDQVGVDLFASVEGPSFNVTISDALIVGGAIGVNADGRDNPNRLIMRDSVVRDQTVASVRISVEWFFVTLDLGNGGGTGGNQLSVVSGTALLDMREEPDEFNGTIDATGMTLNGRSYAGQLIQGPASQPPDYFMLADGQIQF